LLARNAGSPYLAELAARCFAVQQVARQPEKALRVAVSEEQAGRANEDMLLVLGDAALRRKEFAEALDLAGRAKQKLAVERGPARGMALWITGFALGNMERWLECDRTLREALPLIGNNKDLLPAAYFYLGLSNFRLSEGPKGDKTRAADARKYTSLCAAMPGPFQALAQNNLISMGGVPVNPKPPKW
jgi:tetratricopeptide (TPR) repeat protein